MTTQCGLAKNSAAAVQFLNSCEAVREYVTLNASWLEFVYDDQCDVTNVPDHLVWFDGGAAPAEACAAQNQYHNV
jgi:hypothetical protein